MTNIVLGTMIFFGIGSIMMFLPIPLWFLFYGWRHKGKEPPDDLVVGLRTGGMAVVVIGMILLFFQA